MSQSRRGERLSPRLHWALHLGASGLLFAAALLIEAVPDLSLFWLPLRRPLLFAGLGFLALGCSRRWPVFARVSAALCLSVMAVLSAIALVEMVFRWTHYDFRGQEAAWRRLPPFFRRPSVPTSGAFHRRAGPEAWTGQVIRTYVQHERWPTEPYDDEPTITVRYDQFGFRNEPRPAAWDLVVLGDSFTELGHLSFDQLFTTILGQRLHRVVLNLGVSHTGPLAYLSYLEEFGVCPKLAEVLMVFYEGNDLDDAAREHAALRRFEATGERERFEFRRQSSFLRAVGEWRRRQKASAVATAPPVVARFDSPRGPVAVTPGPPPPAPENLTPSMRGALGLALDRYAAFGRERGVRCWLAYMPCKRRVLAERWQFTESASESLRRWAPSALPTMIETECARRGIRFLDLTPRLRAETQRTSELLFNARYDLHLNARGAAAVAEELVRRLGPTAFGLPAPGDGGSVKP